MLHEVKPTCPFCEAGVPLVQKQQKVPLKLFKDGKPTGSIIYLPRKTVQALTTLAKRKLS